MTQRGQRHCDGSRCAAWGLSCELGKPPQGTHLNRVTLYGFPLSPDNPRRLWCSAFSKEEFLLVYSDTPSNPRVS